MNSAGVQPYFADGLVTLYCGQAAEVLAGIPDGSVDCIVTSPPYYGLRDYQVEGQIGTEATPADYVSALSAVFAQARPHTAPCGWCLATATPPVTGQNPTLRSGRPPTAAAEAHRVRDAQRGRHGCADRPPKNLLGMPWRVAFALQDQGWILRNEITWVKTNPMPESVTDRLSCAHEQIFMFSKARRYYFDLDPIRQPHRQASIARAQPHRADPGRAAREGSYYPDRNGHTLRASQMVHEGGRNPGDVWFIPTVPFKQAHFAVFPVEIPRRAIAAGCRPGGVVLDMFSGSGTTGLAAARLGHPYVGGDLNGDYLELSLRTRLKQPSLTAEANRAAAACSDDEPRQRGA